ncbi:MAG: hypothetical protein ABIK61_03175 [candidate division WOR-3 bacterium]
MRVNNLCTFALLFICSICFGNVLSQKSLLRQEVDTEVVELKSDILIIPSEPNIGQNNFESTTSQLSYIKTLNPPEQGEKPDYAVAFDTIYELAFMTAKKYGKQ